MVCDPFEPCTENEGGNGWAPYTTKFVIIEIAAAIQAIYMFILSGLYVNPLNVMGSTGLML